MSGESICGVTTTKGTPCQNNAGSCPWHNTDEPPDTGRPSKLSYDTPEDANELDNLKTLCRPCHVRWEGIPVLPEVNHD